MRDIITIEELSLRIGKRLLFRDLSLTVPAGSIMALMGPAASGKSTLLNLLAGKLTAPHIEVQGVVKKRCRDGCDEGWVQVMRQKPKALVRPAVQWLRTRTSGRTIPQMEAELEELGAGQLLGRLEENPIDWPVARRRLLLLAGHLLQDPDLLCLDEPFAGLDDEEAAPLLELIDGQRGERTILWCTHHQRRARGFSDEVALLAGGRIIEQAPTKHFFESPQSKPARDFVRTGSCNLPSPETPPEFLSSEFRSSSLDEAVCVDQSSVDHVQAPPPEAHAPAEVNCLRGNSSPQRPELHQRPHRIGERYSDGGPALLAATWRHRDDVEKTEPLIFRRPPYEPARRGPSQFHWVWPGLLAGASRPGLLRSLRSDLAALRRVGIQALVTLNEAPLDVEIVAEMGLHYHHLPMEDMTPPCLEQAVEGCLWVDERLARGLAVAYHCRAGIGRTGTMLAAQLMATVHSPADQTVDRLRQIMNRYVQSPSQMRFLRRWYDYLQDRTRLTPGLR